MKKIFIDCGSHFYDGFKIIAEKQNIDKDWVCFSFEANPLTFEASENIRFQLFEKYNLQAECKAVWIDSSSLKVNAALDNECKTYVYNGSNVLDNPPVYDKVYHRDIEYKNENIYVTGFSLSDFILKNVTNDDYCVIKIDIEGSEFKVIDDLIEKKCIDKISVAYIEFHERFFDDINLYKQKREYFERVFAEHSIKILNWH